MFVAFLYMTVILEVINMGAYINGILPKEDPWVERLLDEATFAARQSNQCKTITCSMKAASLSLCTVIENIGKTIAQGATWIGKIIFNVQKKSNLSAALKALGNSIACVFSITILSFCTLFSPQILCKFYTPHQPRFQAPLAPQRRHHHLEVPALHALLEEAWQRNQGLLEQLRVAEMLREQQAAENRFLSENYDKMVVEGGRLQNFLVKLREKCTGLEARIRELEPKKPKAPPEPVGGVPDRDLIAAASEQRLRNFA